jgi:hypothetical protein
VCENKKNNINAKFFWITIIVFNKKKEMIEEIRNFNKSLNNKIDSFKFDNSKSIDSMMFEFKVNEFQLDKQKHEFESLTHCLNYKPVDSELGEVTKVGEKPDWWEYYLLAFSCRIIEFNNISKLKMSRFSQQYYEDRFVALDFLIQKRIVERCIPDALHEVSVFEKISFDVSDYYEGFEYIKRKCEAATPSSSTTNTYKSFRKGFRSNESSKEIKVIVCWDLYNRWKLPPLKKENWFLFKWTAKKLRWRGTVHKLNFIYKPSENSIDVEFEYFIWVLNNQNEWRRI